MPTLITRQNLNKSKLIGKRGRITRKQNEYDVNTFQLSIVEYHYFFGQDEIAGLPPHTGDGGRGMSKSNRLKPPVAKQPTSEPRMR